MEKFILNYTPGNVANHKTTITVENGILNHKLNLRKGKFRLAKIIGFRKFEYYEYDQLVIRYESDHGKIKNYQVLVDRKQPALEEFIKFLDEAAPGKNLEKLSLEEARNVLNTSNVAKKGLIVAIIVVFSIIGVAIWLLPSGPFLYLFLGFFLLIVGGLFGYQYYYGKKDSKDW